VERMNGMVSRALELSTVSALWGIGINCVGIDIAASLAKNLASELESTGLTLVVYPDAGRWNDRTTAQFVYSPMLMSEEQTREWAGMLSEIRDVNRGRVVLGGCCHTDPKFISALASLHR
jgi:S-methylmethionine-dependent homocysteine/selenocysteine methylase